MYCHATATKAERAGFPSARQCRSCHPDRNAIPSFPSHRVYRLADFVIFSHARHAAAKVECTRCHGPVHERDVLTVEVAHSMKNCMDCHKEHKAKVNCNACHELGQ